MRLLDGITDSVDMNLGIPVSLLYSGLAIGGTLANGMVIYLVSSFRKLQTTSNAFIVNGCAADLSVCALWMPQE